MTTQQGELLIRQRNPQTQRPEWARAYVVLAVDERHRKRRVGSTLVRRAIRAMQAQDADEVC